MKTLKNQWWNTNKLKQTQQAMLKVEYSTKNALDTLWYLYILK